MNKKGIAVFNIAKVYLPALIGIIGLFVIGQILSPGFASSGNIHTNIAASGILAVVATGQTIVICAGDFGIDLSLGAIMSTGALLTPMVTGGDNSRVWMAVIAVVAIGAFFGAANGIGVQLIRIPPLAMTLVMSTVVNGFTLAYTKGQPAVTVPRVLSTIGQPLFGQVRKITVLAVLVLVAVQLFLTFSKYGRVLFMVGSNRNAARISGFRVNLVVVLAYTFAGILASFGGLLLVGWVGSGQIKMGASYTMMSIAASVIGGVKLSGGSGNLLGAALGSMVIILLSNVLTAAGLSAGVRTLFEGLILIGILLVNNRAPNLRA